MKHRSEQWNKCCRIFSIWFQSSAALPFQRFTQPLNLEPKCVETGNFLSRTRFVSFTFTRFPPEPNTKHYKTMWPNSSNPCNCKGPFIWRVELHQVYCTCTLLLLQGHVSCPFENESSPWVGDNKCQHLTTLPCLTSEKKQQKSRTKVQIFPSLEGWKDSVCQKHGKSCHVAVSGAALAFQPVTT